MTHDTTTTEIGSESALQAMLDDLGNVDDVPDGWYSMAELAEESTYSLDHLRRLIMRRIGAGEWERERYKGRDGRVKYHYRQVPA